MNLYPPLSMLIGRHTKRSPSPGGDSSGDEASAASDDSGYFSDPPTTPCTSRPRAGGRKGRRGRASATGGKRGGRKQPRHSTYRKAGGGTFDMAKQQQEAIDSILEKEDDYFKVSMSYMINAIPSCSDCRGFNYKNRKYYVKGGRLYRVESSCKKCVYTSIKLSHLLYGLTDKVMKPQDD
jgi:hypothetical protein